MNPSTIGFDLKARLAAAGIHLAVSALIAAGAALLVFGVWYPGAFRQLAGGRDLFLLLVAVDVVMGPALTFAVFNRRKGLSHLRRDLIVIGAMQLAALGYGLHTVFVARPVALVFEVDRFRLVNAQTVLSTELPLAPAELRVLPLTGPHMLSARVPKSGPERYDAMMMGLAGVDIGQRPKFWTPYDDAARAEALGRSRSVADLLRQYPDRAKDIQASLRGLDVPAAEARFLPVMARGAWVAILDRAGRIAGYLPYEGFF